MPSTFAGLNTMVRGIQSQQISQNTVGHNISNAGATGYSRQSVNLAATSSELVPSFYGNAQVGTGVDTVSITRARDVYADKQYWSENGNQGYYDARKENYTKVESMYNDSDNTGMKSKLAKFWAAWQSLGTTSGADSQSFRVTAYETGNVVAQAINKTATDMQSQIKSEYDDMRLKVDRVNEITTQVLKLNKNIVQSEANGSNANDLRDTRDNLIDELSGYVKVSVRENSNGTYSVVSNGNTLVDGNNRLTLECNENTASVNGKYGVTDYAIQIKETGTLYEPGNGTLQGLQDSVSENKDSIDDLAKMASFFLTTFNDQHKAGQGIDTAKTTGTNFFGTNGTNYTWDAANAQVKAGATGLSAIETIKALSVNSALATDSGKNLIAAGAVGEGTAGCANAVLLSTLSSKASAGVTPLGTISLNDYYTGMMSSLGAKSDDVNSRVTQQQDIMTAINSNRQETSGVNWNEELTNMLKFQQGYSACSRCLTTMDSMLDKLINSTGMVGR